MYISGYRHFKAGYVEVSTWIVLAFIWNKRELVSHNDGSHHSGHLKYIEGD